MASRSASRILSKICEAKPLHQQIRTYASKSSSSDRRLYPSVEVLLHQNNLSASDVKATGPQGRLLKGDVLAHLGKINKDTPDKLSQRYEKLSHLDLSNITPAAPKEEKKVPEAAAEIQADVLEDVQEISLNIDLQPVLKLQTRLQETLGQTLQLSELIERAIDRANYQLPASSQPPTTDELFDDILYGPSLVSKVEDGFFVPSINLIDPTFGVVAAPATVRDPFDDLVSTAPSRPIPVAPITSPSVSQGAINSFSILTSSSERKRATVFLQRMKSILEFEPGRLVL